MKEQITIYYPIIKEYKEDLKDHLWYDSFFKKMRKFSCTKLDYKYQEVEYVIKNNEITEFSSLKEEEKKYAKENKLIKSVKLSYPIEIKSKYIVKISSKNNLKKIIESYEDISIEELYSDANSSTFLFKEGSFKDFTDYLDTNLIKWI